MCCGRCVGCFGAVSAGPMRQSSVCIVYLTATRLSAQMTLYAREEVLGRNCRFLQGKFTSRAAVRRVGDAIRARQQCEVELLNYRKDGVAFWNAFTLLPVSLKKDGPITHYIAVQKKVTQVHLPSTAPRNWSTAEVAEWLEQHERTRTLAVSFADSDVDGAHLLRIDRAACKRLKVPPRAANALLMRLERVRRHADVPPKDWPPAKLVHGPLNVAPPDAHTKLGSMSDTSPNGSGDITSGTELSDTAESLLAAAPAAARKKGKASSAADAEVADDIAVAPANAADEAMLSKIRDEPRTAKAPSLRASKKRVQAAADGAQRSNRSSSDDKKKGASALPELSKIWQTEPRSPADSVWITVKLVTTNPTDRVVTHLSRFATLKQLDTFARKTFPMHSRGAQRVIFSREPDGLDEDPENIDDDEKLLDVLQDAERTVTIVVRFVLPDEMVRRVVRRLPEDSESSIVSTDAAGDESQLTREALSTFVTSFQRSVLPQLLLDSVGRVLVVNSSCHRRYGFPEDMENEMPCTSLIGDVLTLRDDRVARLYSLHELWLVANLSAFCRAFLSLFLGCCCFFFFFFFFVLFCQIWFCACVLCYFCQIWFHFEKEILH